MFSKETIGHIMAAADEAGIVRTALLAVADVESGGRAFVVVGGRSEPLIRFEGHYFDRRLEATKRAEARRLGLASPIAGAIGNPASQAARWALLDRAAQIDRKAAFESVSWGLGQVMGAHWAWLGYASVEALAAEARGGAAGQARLMARYIVKAGLSEALSGHDWAAFARGYNGPGYRANAYDTKLARAFAKHADGTEPASSRPATGGLLRRGDRGAAVADLQLALAAVGYPIDADGAFGPLTADAVRRFQRDHALGADGIVGPQTSAALRAAVAKAHPLGWLSNWLAGLWRRIIG